MKMQIIIFVLHVLFLSHVLCQSSRPEPIRLLASDVAAQKLLGNDSVIPMFGRAVSIDKTYNGGGRLMIIGAPEVGKEAVYFLTKNNRLWGFVMLEGSFAPRGQPGYIEFGALVGADGGYAVATQQFDKYGNGTESAFVVFRFLFNSTANTYKFIDSNSNSVCDVKISMAFRHDILAIGCGRPAPVNGTLWPTVLTYRPINETNFKNLDVGSKSQQDDAFGCQVAVGTNASIYGYVSSTKNISVQDLNNIARTATVFSYPEQKPCHPIAQVDDILVTTSGASLSVINATTASSDFSDGAFLEMGCAITDISVSQSYIIAACDGSGTLMILERLADQGSSWNQSWILTPPASPCSISLDSWREEIVIGYSGNTSNSLGVVYIITNETLARPNIATSSSSLSSTTSLVSSSTSTSVSSSSTSLSSALSSTTSTSSGACTNCACDSELPFSDQGSCQNGTWTFGGAVTNTGTATITAGDIVMIGSSFMQQPGATLIVSAGEELTKPKIVVNGTATLNGTLLINADNFQGKSQTVWIVEANSISGQFSHIEVQGGTKCHKYHTTPEYTSSSMTVLVIVTGACSNGKALGIGLGVGLGALLVVMIIALIVIIVYMKNRKVTIRGAPRDLL